MAGEPRWRLCAGALPGRQEQVGCPRPRLPGQAPGPLAPQRLPTPADLPTRGAPQLRLLQSAHRVRETDPGLHFGECWRITGTEISVYRAFY